MPRRICQTSSDGQSLVVLNYELARPGVLKVLTNWFEELKERVPVPLGVRALYERPIVRFYTARR